MFYKNAYISFCMALLVLHIARTYQNASYGWWWWWWCWSAGILYYIYTHTCNIALCLSITGLPIYSLFVVILIYWELRYLSHYVRSVCVFCVWLFITLLGLADQFLRANDAYVVYVYGQTQIARVIKIKKK